MYRIIPAVLASLLTTVSARSATLFQEDFLVDTVPLTNPFSSAYADDWSAAAGLKVTGGWLNVGEGASGGDETRRDFDAPVGGGDLFLGFDLRVNSLPVTTAKNLIGFRGKPVGISGDFRLGRVSIERSADGAASDYDLTFGVVSTAASTASSASVDLAFGQTYRVVFSAELGTGNVKAWIDVDAGSSELLPTLTHTDGSFAFDSLAGAFVVSEFASSQNARIDLDRITVATTFAEAALVANPIPEPAVAVLGSVGVALLARRWTRGASTPDAG